MGEPRTRRVRQATEIRLAVAIEGGRGLGPVSGRRIDATPAPHRGEPDADADEWRRHLDRRPSAWSASRRTSCAPTATSSLTPTRTPPSSCTCCSTPPLQRFCRSRPSGDGFAKRSGCNAQGLKGRRPALVGPSEPVGLRPPPWRTYHAPRTTCQEHPGQARCAA